MSKVREEIRATLISEANEIRKSGVCHWSEMRRRHSNIPAGIMADVCCQADLAEDDEWWDGIEKTIEGEIVKKAIAAHEK